MQIFSQLDSNASTYRKTAGHADGDSYDFPSWPPSLYSSSSTVYPTSSLSPGISDAATSSPSSGSASTSFSPFSSHLGFSQYVHEQSMLSILLHLYVCLHALTCCFRAYTFYACTITAFIIVLLPTCGKVKKRKYFEFVRFF